MYPHGWTMLNAVAAFGPEAFAPGDKNQWLFAWIVNDIQAVQAWLEEDHGWDGTLDDAELIAAEQFIRRANRLFSMPRQAVLPDLAWVEKAWVVHDGDDEVLMVGEGDRRWLIVCYSFDKHTSQD